LQHPRRVRGLSERAFMLQLWSVFVLGLFSASMAQAQLPKTDSLPQSRSETIRYIEKKFAGAVPYPVMIVDRDEIEWLFARANAFGDAKSQTRIEIIRNHIRERTGVLINQSQASNLDPYLTIMKSSAMAFPFFAQTGANEKLCVVLPAPAASNQVLETERILGLSNPKVSGEYRTHHVVKTLSYRQLWLFSLYHELSHCLDAEFMPDAYKSNGDDSHATHKSEAFAETLALLLLAQEGQKNLGENRAILRSIYSRLVGHFLATNPGASLGISSIMHGGGVYHLAPVLNHAQSLIDTRFTDIATADVHELKSLAAKIVREKALKSQSVYAVFVYLSEGYEVTLRRYEEQLVRYPEFFTNVIDSLKEYHAQTERALREGLDLTRPVPPPSPLRLTRFQVEDLCPVYETGDRAGLMRQISAHRKNLERQPGTHEEQRKRAEELQSVYERLPAICLGK
jgi:hypothetical protein